MHEIRERVSSIIFNDISKVDISPTVESINNHLPGAPVKIISPLPVAKLTEESEISCECNFEDYYEIFDALKHNLDQQKTEYVLILRGGCTLTKNIFTEHISDGIYVLELETGERANLFKSNSPSSIPELLAHPLVPWGILANTRKYQHLGGINPELLHFCFWDLLIRHARPLPAIPCLPNIKDAVRVPEIDLTRTPIHFYNEYLLNTKPALSRELRNPSDEWSDLQQVLSNKIIETHGELYTKEIPRILSGLFSDISAQKAARFQAASKRKMMEKELKQLTLEHTPHFLLPIYQTVSDFVLKAFKATHSFINRLLKREPITVNDSKLRALFITTHSPFTEVTGPIAAGAEIAMRQIAEMLAQRGHNVHYLTFARGLQSSVLLNGVNVHFSPAESQSPPEVVIGRIIVKLAESLSRFAERRSSGSFIRQVLPELRKFRQWSHFYFWSHKRSILRIARKHKINIIHCFSSMPDSLAVALVSNRTGIPMTIRMGGRFWYLKYFATKKKSREKYLEHMQYILDCTNLLAYNSKALQSETEKMLRDLGLTYSGPETVVDIGVQLPSNYKDSSTLDLNTLEGKFVISCVGKFKTNSKRQDLLITALSKLPFREKVQIVFAGNGPTEEDMKKLARDEGVDSSTTFLGNIGREDVFHLIDRSDIFAHPTEFEGSSKAVAEAMLCGKCVIASNIPALSEHIEHYRNGALVNNTPDCFAKVIEELYLDRELRNKLGDNAKLYANEHFDPEQNILRYEETFFELLKSIRAADNTSRIMKQVTQNEISLSK